jgi:hypothetical protein
MAWASPYPSPADAPVDYPEQIRRILEAPYVAPNQDVYEAERRKDVV